MFKTPARFALLLAPLLLLLVACGGGDKDDSGSSGSSSNDRPAASSGSSGSSSSASGDDSFSLENCKEYASLAASFTGAFGTTSSGGVKIDKNALNDLAKKSPQEIRSDMQVVVGAVISFLDTVEKLGVNLNDPASFTKLDAAKLQELQKASEKLTDDVKVQQASDRIEQYFQKKCS